MRVKRQQNCKTEMQQGIQNLPWQLYVANESTVPCLYRVQVAVPDDINDEIAAQIFITTLTVIGLVETAAVPKVTRSSHETRTCMLPHVSNSWCTLLHLSWGVRQNVHACLMRSEWSTDGQVRQLQFQGRQLAGYALRGTQHQIICPGGRQRLLMCSMHTSRRVSGCCRPRRHRASAAR